MSEQSEKQDTPKIVYGRGRLDTGDYVIEAKKITYTHALEKAEGTTRKTTKNLISK